MVLSIVEKYNKGKGIPSVGEGLCIYIGSGGFFSDEQIFNQRPGGSERASCVNIWGKRKVEVLMNA